MEVKIENKDLLECAMCNKMFDEDDEIVYQMSGDATLHLECRIGDRLK